MQTIASNDGNLDLALSALNSTKHEITLRRIRNLTNWFQNEHEYTIETIGERLGETNGVGKVDRMLLIRILIVKNSFLKYLQDMNH